MLIRSWVLYGDPTSRRSATGDSCCSFAEVSERDDYLMPTNFKRLHANLYDQQRRSVLPPLLPALATLQGVSYPGPAILGDARALTAFLLQRRLYRPGDSELTGWALFSDPVLQHGGLIELLIDLAKTQLDLQELDSGFYALQQAKTRLKRSRQKRFCVKSARYGRSTGQGREIILMPITICCSSSNSMSPSGGRRSSSAYGRSSSPSLQGRGGDQSPEGI